MDQRRGQHVDLGLYFHREGPVSPKIMLKNRFWVEKIRKFQKTIDSSTKLSLLDRFWIGLCPTNDTQTKQQKTIQQNPGTRGPNTVRAPP